MRVTRHGSGKQWLDEPRVSAPSPTSLMARGGKPAAYNLYELFCPVWTVLCRCPNLLSTSSEGSLTLRKGSAQYRLVQGGFTISIRQSHFKPRLIFLCFCEERTGS